MKEENEKNSSRDQNSRRSFIAELSMLKEMTKQQTRVSGLDINSFQIEKKDDQILQRVCCIRINRKWRIKRQIFITTTVVFLIVLGILMSFMGGNVYYTRHNIQQQIQTNVESRSNDDLLIFGNSFEKIFNNIENSVADNLNIINEILNGYLEPISDTFNYNLTGAYPVQINNSFYAMVNNLTQTDKEENSNQTLKYWGYASFSTKNLSYYSTAGERYLNASTLLTYAFRELFFWNLTQTSNFLAIYIGFITDNLFVYYPGQNIPEAGWVDYNPQLRNWYTLAEANQYNNNCSLTPDYIDQSSKLRISTFSKPLLDSQKKNFYGVIAVDFILEKFQDFFDEMQFLNSFLLVLDTNGTVVNNAFNYISNDTYYVYNSSITNLTMAFWNQIQNPENYKTPLSVTNTENIKFISTINYFNQSNQTIAFYIILMTKVDEIESFINSLNEERDGDYWIILYSMIATIIGVLFLAISTNIYISYQIVKPLLRLTKVAEIINKIEKISNSAEEIKKRIDIQSEDEQIAELTSIFRKVLFGIVGSKREKVEYASGNQKINYSVNFMCFKEMKFRDQFDKITDYQP